MLQRNCCLNNASTKLMRGDYVAACIYQFPPFRPEKSKHVVSEQTHKCPHNTVRPLRKCFVVKYIRD